MAAVRMVQHRCHFRHAGDERRHILLRPLPLLFFLFPVWVMHACCCSARLPCSHVACRTLLQHPLLTPRVVCCLCVLRAVTLRCVHSHLSHPLLLLPRPPADYSQASPPHSACGVLLVCFAPSLPHLSGWWCGPRIRLDILTLIGSALMHPSCLPLGAALGRRLPLLPGGCIHGLVLSSDIITLLA